MFQLIDKLHTILNLIKGFQVGYNNKTANEGKCIIEYCGERFFVRIEKIKEPFVSMLDDIDRLEYFD